MKMYVAKVAPPSPSDQPGRPYVRTRVIKVVEGFDVMSGKSPESARGILKFGLHLQADWCRSKWEPFWRSGRS